MVLRELIFHLWTISPLNKQHFTSFVLFYRKVIQDPLGRQVFMYAAVTGAAE